MNESSGMNGIKELANGVVELRDELMRSTQGDKEFVIEMCGKYVQAWLACVMGQIISQMGEK